MTVGGILIKHGIPSSIKYGGLVKIKDRIPTTYTDLISYQGTSLDPIQIFTARKMTSILAAVQRGDGAVLANMQTVPSIAAERTLKLLQDAKRAGIVGWIESPLEANFLGVNSGDDVMEINIFAGTNPMASLCELDMQVKAYSLSSLMDAKLLNQRL
jgi:repressor of nif and glnA expression